MLRRVMTTTGVGIKLATKHAFKERKYKSGLGKVTTVLSFTKFSTVCSV